MSSDKHKNKKLHFFFRLDCIILFPFACIPQNLVQITYLLTQKFKNGHQWYNTRRLEMSPRVTENLRTKQSFLPLSPFPPLPQLFYLRLQFSKAHETA